MELIWGEDFDVLSDVARSVYETRSPLVDRERTVDHRSLIHQFARLDWLTLGEPRADHESATGLTSIAAVLVEQGRALVCSPLLPLITVRDVALMCGGAAATDLAGVVGDGSCVAMPAFHDPAWDEPPPTLSGGALSGTVLAVSHADIADVLLVEALGDATGESERVLVAVRLDALPDPVEMPHLGGQPMFAVTFDRVPVSDDDVLARGTAAGRAIGIARQRATVLLASQVYGAGQALLERTVRYARERHQFGGPIGRFQAVQYLCTDIAVGVHLTSAFIREAARLIDDGLDPVVEVALLARQARTTAQEMVHAAHEVHAGIGFMVESDVHLFTTASRKWAFDLGDDRRDDHQIFTELMRLGDGGQR